MFKDERVYKKKTLKNPSDFIVFAECKNAIESTQQRISTIHLSMCQYLSK